MLFTYARCRKAAFPFAVVASLFLFVLATSASALSYNNLIVFGDSIVDQGNTQATVLMMIGLLGLSSRRR